MSEPWTIVILYLTIPWKTKGEGPYKRHLLIEHKSVYFYDYFHCELDVK